MPNIASIICVAAVAVLFASSAPAEVSAAPAALRDGSHDMDFNFGTWRSEVTRIPDPFGDPSNIVHMAGKVSVKPIWNGKGWLEEVEADGPKGHWQGANLFFYDPTAHQWIQTYVDSGEGRFDEPAGIGEWRDGNVEYYSPDTVGGRAVLDRAVWSDIKPDSHTYTESFSDDGGRTWHPVFIAHLTRLQP